MNINNGKTGNVNIPGALHSTGGDGDGQVGGVVAYAGDVYDETLGKNQKEINQTLLDGSGDSNVIAVALNDLNEKVEEQEKVTSSGLNDLNDKTDNLGKDIEDLEKTTSSSLNDLNEKIDNLSDEVNDNEKTTASALADLDEKTNTNEKAVSAALNDLNDKIDNSAQPASNVSFDDQNINIGADNVQDAIRIAFTNIQSTTCTLNLTVYKDSAVLANKSVHIDVTYQGVVSSTLSGDYTTSSQGLISISLPLGSIYTITFNNETNYRKPDTINGIADDNIKNISVLYESVAENERVILICNIRGTNSNITANNKIAYIHYTNSDYTVNLSNDPEWTITFNNLGSPSSIVNEGVIKQSILIPFGTYYTVELEDWDTSLQSDEQSFSKSPIIKTRALNESKVINLSYNYLLSGMFVVLKDDNDSAFGYTSYKVIDVDTQNDITTILINDVEYNIKYTAGIGIQKSIRGANEYEVWIPSANMDTEIIGVGIKTQRLNDAPLLAQEGIDQGYSKCSFMICKITYPTNSYTMNVQPITNIYDGKYGTINAVNAETYSQCANAAYNITKVTGNHTQHGFLPSSYQWSTICPANYLKIKSILASLNISISISGKYWLATRYLDAGGSGNANGMAWGTNNGVNMDGNYNDATVSNTKKCFPIFLFN